MAITRALRRTVSVAVCWAVLFAAQHMGQQHVDPVAGIDEARDRRGRVIGTLTARVPGCSTADMKPRVPASTSLPSVNRLAGRDRTRAQPAPTKSDIGACPRRIGRRQAALGPGLPAQVVGLDDLPGVTALRRHQHLQGGATTGATSRCTARLASKARRSLCSQARAMKAVAPATITASRRKTMRLLLMRPSSQLIACAAATHRPPAAIAGPYGRPRAAAPAVSPRHAAARSARPPAMASPAGRPRSR
jgi:hypothetical protein